MRIEAIKEFRIFIEQAQSIFLGALKDEDRCRILIDCLKQKYSADVFKLKFEAFENELTDNIRKYEDDTIIVEYLKSKLDDFERWMGIELQWVTVILSEEYEIEFLLMIKNEIDKIKEKLVYYTAYDRNGFLTGIAELRSNILKQEIEEREKCTLPAFDKRFDFNQMKMESDLLGSSLERIRYITDRLFDFEQWQQQYDVTEGAFGLFVYSTQYYPRFKELCQHEIKRQKVMMEFEKTESVASGQPLLDFVPETEHGRKSMVWKADRTALLELIVALHEENVLVDSEGLPLSRKELLEFFQLIFNIELKDPDSLLSKATERSTEKAPFLKKLRSAFSAYCDRKLVEKAKFKK